MYSGLLPKGLTEDDLSPDDDEEEEEKKRRDSEKLSSTGENTGSPVEAKANNTASGADTELPTCSLPGIPQETWQKFQDLQKKREEMKTLKDPRRRKRRRHKKGTNSDEPGETSEPQKQLEKEKHWDGLKQYFGVNDRFHPPACSKPAPKSGLEKSIERAIAEGDIAKAEEMSDRLATRELAVKIAQAADCRDFAQRKQEEEALRAAQKGRSK
ncbi:protein FAM204A isoform X2 [Sphaeramia orbicularis]|uniref:protein FAM204A isoform X2 n=1 Tax=Sphaeramia orbicularis TaxID=375764 RepID=UPI00117DC746|nr:protein FAM204A isoform X2 [Sphaeramia orbicularis]